MFDYLLGILARWSSGERFRKSTPADWRYQSGFFFLLPVAIMAVIYFGHPFMEHASATQIFLAMTGFIIGFTAALFTWAKFVPAMVSVILGIIAWAAFAWFSWHYL
jgi:hypothetical protein